MSDYIEIITNPDGEATLVNIKRIEFKCKDGATYDKKIKSEDWKDDKDVLWIIKKQLKWWNDQKKNNFVKGQIFIQILPDEQKIRYRFTKKDDGVVFKLGAFIV